MNKAYSLEWRDVLEEVVHGGVKTKTVTTMGWLGLRTVMEEMPLTEEELLEKEQSFLSNVDERIINLCKCILEYPEDLKFTDGDTMKERGNFEYNVGDFKLEFQRFENPFGGYEIRFRPSYFCDNVYEVGLVKKCLDRIIIWNNGRWQRDTL